MPKLGNHWYLYQGVIVIIINEGVDSGRVIIHSFLCESLMTPRTKLMNPPQLNHLYLSNSDPQSFVY